MEGSQPWQTPAYLLVIPEVERFPHVPAALRFCRGVSVGAGRPALPKGVRVTGQSFIRPGRHEVEVFIEDDVLVPADRRDTYGGMSGQC